MSTVIKVENLSKRYYLSHQQKENFPTLRDAITRTASNVGRRLMHPLRASSGQPLEGLDSTEEFWALNDVSFEVKQGDRVGIIGRNGAGKSTLLKILSRITEPTRGRVSIKGRVASLLEVGTGFHPELTGRENIFLNGAILGMSKADIRRKFDKIVAFSEVEKFLDTPVKRYSSGMYVRLAFAVAAHLEPEILIVDEVLAVGDAAFQKKCLGKMAAVGREGRTVLFVSHNMSAIQHLCCNSFLLQEGRLVSSGETASIIEKYFFTSEKKQNGFVDLSDHPKRVPCSTPFFAGLELRVNGKVSNSTFMGEGIEIHIHYESQCKINGLRIGVSFTDQFGKRIVNFSPSHQATLALENAPRSGKVICKIPSMNLVQDNYLITLIAGDNLGDIDRIEGFCTFEVLATDVFGTGKIPDAHHGVLFLPATWEVFGK